jgi:hypothetical protein
MPAYRRYFIRAVAEKYGTGYEKIITDIDKHYQTISPDIAFAKTSQNPIDRRLDFTAYFLALIKTLHEKGETYETIRKICLDVVTEYVKPKNSFQLFLKRIPANLVNTLIAKFFIKAFNKKVNKNSNTDGFIAEIITDKESTFGLGYGIDILECGICKLYKKHNYEQYASILCEVDEITSNLAGLKLIRTGTIANGAKKCDFRFMKIKEQNNS